MEPAEYAVMFANEDRHWWYVGLHDLVLSLVDRHARSRPDPTILDAGCGTGKLLEGLRGRRAVGLEWSAEALPFLRRRGVVDVARGSVERLPFPGEAFDLVVSLDVLCCLPGPGDLEALRELGRVLKPGGLLLLNLPAFRALRGHHDAAVHIRQRYTRGRLRTMLGAAGLRGRTITYRNSVLLPAAASVRVGQRLARPRPTAPKSDVRPLPGPLNRALSWPLLLENRLIRAGGRLPAGLSVFCVATKG